uniref:Outer row dynein assembly protein n=1 Tax=Tetraselmis sp. GSL018 TaxID=582737 RepID=A0A061QW97_9CHLO|mmetsp:Transcript_23183/g.55454  ORF Transcript_23183/g.55454 Transcript_23183/m.55454 type:complete len:525 (-) Transcript_23183:457-2031(-)
MSDHDSFEAKDMNARDIRRICRERGSFSVPSCTTILYLHQQKFKTVSGLEEYKACKVLHLENNCLTDVSGLSHMSSLRVLHLQSNAISSLEGLASCTRLDTLNVSGNPIRDMGSLPASLRTLRASHMGQWDASVVLQIAVGCPSLQVLDLQRDGLEGEGVVEALSRLRELRVLYLQGNPLPSLQNYRRRLVSGLPDLCYLDDRPVEDIERAGAAAWIAGGAEAERAARMAFRDAKWEQERRSVYSFARERAARRAARGAAQGARPRGVAAPAAMDSLPSEALPSAAGDCSICSEGLLKGETVTTLPCGHGFHSRCIRPWLECFSDSCPLCRQTVRTAPAQAREPPRPQTAHARRSAGRDSAARCPDAPPRCSMGASFCAADLVRSHALEDMARGLLRLLQLDQFLPPCVAITYQECVGGGAQSPRRLGTCAVNGEELCGSRRSGRGQPTPRWPERAAGTGGQGHPEQDCRQEQRDGGLAVSLELDGVSKGGCEGRRGPQDGLVSARIFAPWRFNRGRQIRRRNL